MITADEADASDNPYYLVMVHKNLILDVRDPSHDKGHYMEDRGAPGQCSLRIIVTHVVSQDRSPVATSR